MIAQTWPNSWWVNQKTVSLPCLALLSITQGLESAKGCLKHFYFYCFCYRKELNTTSWLYFVSRRFWKYWLLDLCFTPGRIWEMVGIFWISLLLWSGKLLLNIWLVSRFWRSHISLVDGVKRKFESCLFLLFI